MTGGAVTLSERVQTAQEPRCGDPWRLTHCTRPATHEGLHSDGDAAWGFRDPFIPEWVRRAQAHELPAKELAR